MVILYYMLVGLFLFMLIGNAIMMIEIYRLRRELIIFQKGLISFLIAIAQGIDKAEEEK